MGMVIDDFSLPWALAMQDIPVARGVSMPGPGATVARSRLPSDPIGSITATFAGVHADSEIRVYSALGVELAGIESCAADQALTWDIFTSSDVVTIRIIAQAYRLKEFTYVAHKGGAEISVQQERDKFFSNPV